MSKTDYIYIKGMIKWMRNQTPNEWGKWAHVMYPDAEGLEKIRDLQADGLKNTLKKDEDGYFVSFSRPTSKVFKNKVQGMEPPLVLDGRMKLEDGSYPPYREMVGNGSQGITKLEVYSHGTPGGGKAKAARWMSTLLTEIVPYQPKSDMTEADEYATRGLSEQVEKIF